MIIFLEDLEKWKCDYQACEAKCCMEGRELTLQDIKRILAKEKKKKWSDFASFDRETMTIRLKGEKGKCIFLKSDFSCKIWLNRPLVCRLLPFKIENISYSDEPIMRLRPEKFCPGYGKGPKLGQEFKHSIEQAALQLIRERQELFRKLKENLLEEEL